MTEILNTPAAEVTPIVPAIPEAPKPRTMAADLPDGTLALRLEQARETERKKVLAELGVSDLDAAKSAVVAARAADEAKKTEAERLAAATLRVTNLEAALGVAVAHAAKGITPEQKAAVDAIAGNDQALWLRTYGALAPTWGKPAVVVPVAPVVTATPILPTSTAPLAPAPLSDSHATSPANHAEVYASLKSNPFEAAAYLHAHGSACYKT
jgi:hypothetical protein